MTTLAAPFFPPPFPPPLAFPPPFFPFPLPLTFPGRQDRAVTGAHAHILREVVSRIPQISCQRSHGNFKLNEVPTLASLFLCLCRLCLCRPSPSLLRERAPAEIGPLVCVTLSHRSKLKATQDLLMGATPLPAILILLQPCKF